MNSKDIIHKIAFVECNKKGHLLGPGISNIPCFECTEYTSSCIKEAEYIDTELIETTAIILANVRGDYTVTHLTTLQLREAFSLLFDLVPFIKRKVQNGT